MLFVLGVTAYIKENGWCVQFDVLQGQLTCFRLMKYMYLKGGGSYNFNVHVYHGK